jgi:hypothetical protein
MNARIVIEFPSAGATYPSPGQPDRYGVYKYDEYPRGSVLEGTERRSLLGQYDSLEEAQKEHPEAEWNGGGSGYREIVIPDTAPGWFDPAYAGERWSDDY